jgi:uncharacterized membrane protein YeaQ/YmgE (transglycosylase-associated protein family)
MNILWIIVIGFVAGIVARFLAPGPNNPQGFILTTILGIVGAFLATFLGGRRLVPARSGRGPYWGGGRRGGRAGRLASAGVARGYPRPRLPPLVVALAAGSAALAPDRAALHDCPGRPPFDHYGARRTDSAGDGDAIDVLALPHAQDDATRFVGSNFHQRCNDFHLFLEIVCQTLRGDNRFFDCGRITPHPPPSVLGFPYIVHFAPWFRYPSKPIIGSLPHCSKEIVRCTQDKSTPS